MPSFGAEYNTILANLAALYDLRQEKIELVKINRRIDQVGSLIRHPLVQDSTGVIHSLNTATGTYVPVSVLSVAELPNVAHYQNGAIVTVDGVLYVKKDGAWEGVGVSSQTLTFTATSLGTAGNETAFILIDPAILDEYSLYKIDAYAEGLYEGNKMYLMHQGYMIVRERNDVNTYLPAASNQIPQALLTFGGIGEAGQVTFYVGTPLDFTIENYSGNEVKVFMKLTKIMSIA
ncbi:hypothetical protein ANAEL_01682 [Anaerolineales bacterium]|nr:hypothetical protein ANAEL_01682 [Anaerolineales bacterium]